MKLPGLYHIFEEKWSQFQTCYIISDTHFGDIQLKENIANRPSDNDLIQLINSRVGKKDILLHLGDVGNIEHVRKIRGYKILIMGNHDTGRTNYERKIIKEIFAYEKYTQEEVKEKICAKYPNCKLYITKGLAGWIATVDNGLFDEVYEGPLMIGEKLILSHEPLDCSWAFNIHGHNHFGNRVPIKTHLNVCSDVIKYTPLNLNNLLKTGLTSYITSIHRSTIDTATKRKQKRTQKKK